MSLTENNKINEDKLKQVNGGLYGGSSGHWVAAVVIAPMGLYGYHRGSHGFTKDKKILIPCGENIPADMNRTTSKYIVVFYNDREVWVERYGLELL
jgi:hypothetical protein